MSIASEIAKSVVGPPRTSPAPTRVFAHVTPAVYADLRRLARCFMRGERGDHTLQATALVNEAFLRLSEADLQLRDALHLYRVVAQTMRRVLVDHARRRKRLKRAARATDENALDIAETYEACSSPAELDVIDVDAALDKLALRAPRAAALIELRYFAGLEDAEIGELYGVSRPTVEREFRFAKAFLIAYGQQARE